MQKATVTLTELKLVGITTRTNNSQIFEKDPYHSLKELCVPAKQTQGL